ncbi:MAG: c-type cytochrome domain-containing protein [Pirellulales bacterium]
MGLCTANVAPSASAAQNDNDSAASESAAEESAANRNSDARNTDDERRAAGANNAAGAADTSADDASAGEDSPQPKSPFDVMRGTVDEAIALYRIREFTQSADRAAEARRQLATLSESAGSLRAKRLLAPWSARLSNLVGRLTEKGVSLPAAPADDADPDDTDPDGDDARANASPPSFVRDVVPVLVRRCRSCHVNKASGELSLANYADLTRGGKNGPVLVPGSAAESRLVDVLNSGEMPAQGSIEPEEIAAIARWVDAGARFDGDDPATSIVALLGSQPRPPQDIASTANAAGGLPAARRPSGDETVSFVRDLAPVLREQCDECHGRERNSADLRLDTFAALLSGGQSGVLINPGSGGDSLLVKRLRGDVDTQMPLDRPRWTRRRSPSSPPGSMKEQRSTATTRTLRCSNSSKRPNGRVSPTTRSPAADWKMPGEPGV